MITIDELETVVRIDIAGMTGSCFSFCQDGRQYIITARHLMRQSLPIDHVRLWLFDRWQDVSVKIVGMGDHRYPEDDTLILASDEQIFPFSLTGNRGGFYLTQDVYFLGYPYNAMTDGIWRQNLALPLVKKGIVSGVISGVIKPGLIVLDGHNNPGFSGGPVLARPANGQGASVIGVVSGYRTDIVQVDGADDLYVEANAGLINVAPMLPILDRIDINPIGAIIQDGWDWHSSRFFPN